MIVIDTSMALQWLLPEAGTPTDETLVGLDLAAPDIIFSGRQVAATAGYSGTPLPKKLGLGDGQRVLFIDLPVDLAALASAARFAEVRRAGWDDWQDAPAGYDLIHAFTASRGILAANAGTLRDAIARDGMIWVSWPKRASGVPTDVTEDVIREIVLPLGLVDVKVAAVSDIWSGLKLVIRKELR